MPEVPTIELVKAITATVGKLSGQTVDVWTALNALDVVRGIYRANWELTPKQVAFGCYLAAADYDRDAIEKNYLALQAGCTVADLVALGWLDPADAEAVGEVLGS
jgi:hypothetical protein